MFKEVLEIPNFTDLYLKIYEFSYETIKDLSLCLSSEIESFFKNKKKEEINVEFMILSYIFLKNLEKEMITSFTPSNEIIDNSQLEFKQVVFKNAPFVTNIHQIMGDFIKDIPHTDLINIIMIFSQTKVTKKDDETFNLIKNINKIYDDNTTLEAMKYISYCTKNKDEFEELYKKNLVRKIILNGLNEYSLSSIEHIIKEISLLPDICIQVNKTILKSFKLG